jgi:SagB-type dehydrogenase family enzyme
MRQYIGLVMTSIIILFLMGPLHAQDAETIKLPAVQKGAGVPLMEALQDRHSNRSFGEKELSKQHISNILWAAFGINRPESGKRTAPSANNRQETDIYVALPNGLYLYDADAHALELVIDEDIRAATGTQAYVGDAAMNLVYVADLAKLDYALDDTGLINTAAGVGFIGQNVYLYCASEGLAAVVRGSIDREKLHDVMQLREEQKIILAHSVGYPAE